MTINNIVDYTISILLGLIIGIIIGYFVFPNSIYVGPDSNDIKKEIFEENGIKFKWMPEICICPISYSMNILNNPDLIKKNKIIH